MRLPHRLLGSDTRGTGNAAPPLRASDRVSNGIADRNADRNADSGPDIRADTKTNIGADTGTDAATNAGADAHCALQLGSGRHFDDRLRAPNHHGRVQKSAGGAHRRCAPGGYHNS